VRLTLIEAHALCAALVAVDLLARAVRIRWILGGLGHRIGFRDAFTLNAVGDAACAVTPMRIGGEPARLGGMLRAGVPGAAAVIAIGLEVLAAWPVTIVAAGWLAWTFAPAWWTAAGPRLVSGIAGAWPWVVGVAGASALAWCVVRRSDGAAQRGHRSLRRSLRRSLVYLRRIPLRLLLATAPLSLVNLVARVGVLPVLALTLADQPAMGPLWLGSFALLYAQLVLPTPSGAGAVELGFLHGAAGELGPSEASLLLAWRFYTSGVGIILGVWLAARIYGVPAFRRLVTGAAAR
jgi:uncharacterized membrane protein YbhN (UPF0104 family)